jgi:hypothetical protein
MNARGRPNYWMAEESGVLRPAVLSYLQNTEFKPGYLEALRAYCRQWIDASAWDENPHWSDVWLAEMRARVDQLTTREKLQEWLRMADEGGMDPL